MGSTKQKGAQKSAFLFGMNCMIMISHRLQKKVKFEGYTKIIKRRMQIKTLRPQHIDPGDNVE